MPRKQNQRRNTRRPRRNLLPPTVNAAPWNRVTVVSMVKAASSPAKAVRLSASSLITALKAQIGLQSTGNNGLEVRFLSQTVWVAWIAGQCIDLAASWFSLVRTADDKPGNAIPEILKSAEALSVGPYGAKLHFRWPAAHSSVAVVEKNDYITVSALVDLYTNISSTNMAVYTEVLWRSQDGQSIPTPSLEVDIDQQFRGLRADFAKFSL